MAKAKQKTQGNIVDATIMANRLLPLESCSDVVLVRVTIGNTTFYGCRYKYTTVIEAKHRLASEGPCEAGEQTWCYRMELLGPTPASYKRGKAVYTYDSGLPWPRGHNYEMRGEWYVGGYYDNDTPNDYHPVGRMFSLHEHQPMDFGYYKDWRIDQYETTRKRMPMEVEIVKELS